MGFSCQAILSHHSLQRPSQRPLHKLCHSSSSFPALLLPCLAWNLMEGFLHVSLTSSLPVRAAKAVPAVKIPPRILSDSGRQWPREALGSVHLTAQQLCLLWAGVTSPDDTAAAHQSASAQLQTNMFSISRASCD